MYENESATLRAGIDFLQALTEKDYLLDPTFDDLDLEKGAFKPGRPEGTSMTKEELLAKYPKVVKRLQAGRTIREVAGESGRSTKTVQKIKNALKED